LIEKYEYVHFNLDRLKMPKRSYDLNHEGVKSRHETDGFKNISQNSRSYGATGASSSEYILDRYYYSLY